MAISKLEFPDGFAMPVFGLGTWQSTDVESLEQALCVALEAGYPLIDTALSYDNEQVIGDTIKKRMEQGKLKREDIFVTSKLPGIYMGCRERVRQGFMRSYGRLQLDFIDLYLIHSPVGFKLRQDGAIFPMGSDGRLEVEHCDLVQTWKCLEELVDEGKIRSLGVSNFNASQIERIQAVARHPICNQQVECHVYFQQTNLRHFCQQRAITFTAFGPMGSPQYAEESGFSSEDQPLNNPLVVEIAEKHSKTPAQVLLRFLLQEGIAIIPKSVTPHRLIENIQVFDFTISAKDMTRLRALGEKNKRIFTFDVFVHSPEFPFREPF